MANDPMSSRDVRPVVAAGLCLIAVILAWPLLRGEEPAPPSPALLPADALPVSPASAPSAGTRDPTGPAPPQTTAAAGNRTTHASGSPPSRPAPRPEPERDDGADTADAKTGIAVFPPPGTDPPKPGIVVPDDYELPPGYVRHHQTTDDGQQLPPILMFHPDFQPVDDRGRPIPLPADRVVPPHMLPPGLPRQVLEVPPSHVPFVEDPPADAAAEPAH